MARFRQTSRRFGKLRSSGSNCSACFSTTPKACEQPQTREHCFFFARLVKLPPTGLNRALTRQQAAKGKKEWDNWRDAVRWNHSKGQRASCRKMYRAMTSAYSCKKKSCFVATTHTHEVVTQQYNYEFFLLWTRRRARALFKWSVGNRCCQWQRARIREVRAREDRKSANRTNLKSASINQGFVISAKVARQPGVGGCFRSSSSRWVDLWNDNITRICDKKSRWPKNITIITLRC